MTDGLHVEQSNSVLRVTIDAGPGNLFAPEMTKRLAQILDYPPEGVHVVHLAATGDTFCLGRAAFRAGVDELQADIQGLVALNRALRESPAVTVAEVQGDAAGFGVGVVALSDVSIASPQARLSFPEVDAGFAPALVLSWLTPMVGRQMAFWLTASGVEIGAAEAREVGLLTLVAERPDSLRETVDRTVATIASKPPSVHRDIKNLMRFYAGIPDGAISEAAADRFSFGALRRALTADLTELDASTA